MKSLALIAVLLLAACSGQEGAAPAVAGPAAGAATAAAARPAPAGTATSTASSTATAAAPGPASGQGRVLHYFDILPDQSNTVAVNGSASDGARAAALQQALRNHDFKLAESLATTPALRIVYVDAQRMHALALQEERETALADFDPGPAPK